MGDPITIKGESDIAHAIKAGRDQVQLFAGVEAREPVIAVPAGFNVLELPKQKLEEPRFLVANPLFHQVEGFIDYLDAFKVPATRVWYSMAGTFVAVIDYHTTETPADEALAMHGDHTARLDLVPSQEWKEWVSASEKPLSQTDFAEFLEDHIQDILTPDPEVMMHVATNLSATQNATFRSAMNLANGSVGLCWDQQTAGKVSGSEAQVPTTFTIALRPFLGCDRYPVECRLRYRIREGVLKLFFKVLRTQPLVENTLDQIVARIIEATSIPVALGEHDAAAMLRGR